MSGPRDDLFARLAAALASNGWTARATPDGVEFLRHEPVSRGEFELRLTFDGARPHLPPTATTRIVKGDPTDFPWHRIGAVLCHLDASAIEWDPESPQFESHVVYVAQHVIDEFHRLQQGKALIAADMEFAVHWAGQPCLLDIPARDWPPADDARLERLEFTAPETQQRQAVYRLTGQSEDRFSVFSERRSIMLVPAVYVELKEAPSPAQAAWPPQTLADLNIFLHRHHPKDGRRVWQRLAAALADEDAAKARALVVIETTVGRFGALVSAGQGGMHGFRAKKLPEILSQTNLVTRNARVDRRTFLAIDQETVLGRNQPEARIPLAGKHIHLVGLGAVGSVLAQHLVRAGAGSGGGSLHLVDFDTLRPENLGRHLLGAPYLGMNKAQGVALFLRRNLLATNVTAHPTAWLGPSVHQGADLVIDATAVPWIGTAMSNDVRANRRYAMVSAFVEGEGWVAGTFLYRGVPGEACRSCMDLGLSGTGCSVPKSVAPAARDNGCGGTYMPFRSAASDTAAALASELICDWVSGLKGKTFRTTRLSAAPSHVHASRYETPRSKPGCRCAA
jgi:molybdopterin/thiamine biosynthesis adenylyltransferase